LRKVERALIGEYRDLVLRSLETLSPSTSDVAAQIAELPDLVRGYESIKLRNVARFRQQAAALEAELLNPHGFGGAGRRTPWRSAIPPEPTG